MGQAIDSTRFDARDFARFAARLHEETDHLRRLTEHDGFSRRPPSVGLELEAWLIDDRGRPAARNEEFLARVNSPEVVTELAQFNIEMNVPPQMLAGRGLEELARDFQAHWDGCRRAARTMGLRVVAVGILPSLRDGDLCLANISAGARYRALNEQILRCRAGRPIRLDIEGADGEHLVSEHDDVMLEAGATSLQAHVQVTQERAVRTYNASVIASAVTVAVAANSPFLFGRPLWHESRIALYEQSMDIGAVEGSYRGVLPRVTLGGAYAGFSLAEFFRENADVFPMLLPVALDEPVERMPHLRLHNGTIWRWNRPLVGFDDDGTPHLRIEHRPMSAGPTIEDMMANLAFYYGMVGWLATETTPPELRLPFDDARANFYAAARFGLNAEILWLDGDRVRLADLVVESLIDHAHDGLSVLGVDADLADRWLGIIEQRAERGQNGAVWQRRFRSAHGDDMETLTLEYAARQADGQPVHLWSV